MSHERYLQCPLRAERFSLVHFTELPSMVFGPDGHCICTEDSKCVNVDKRTPDRCSIADMEKLDREAVIRRAWQAGEDF